MKMCLGGFIALTFCLLAVSSSESQARRYGQPGGDHEAGQFDYYTLALSWSPTYCASKGGRDGSPQCSGPRPFAFVLHGLWPQYSRGWPQFCATSSRPWVPERTINDMLEIMPSKRLIIHEYKKHGTCAGLSPDDYFDVARKLYESIKIPERYKLPERTILVSRGEVIDAFIQENPDLKPEMIAVSCGDRRLQELRVCFGRDLKPRPCGDNENARKLCSRDELIMPPVRQGRASAN